MPNSDSEGRQHRDIHDDKGKTFFRFMQSLEEDDRVRLTRSLTEQEKVDFCSSEEEFRMIFGRESNVPFGEARPIREQDVTEDAVSEEQLQDRLNMARRMFPGSPPSTLDEMKSLANIDRPSKGMNLKLVIALTQGDGDDDMECCGPHKTLAEIKEEAGGEGEE